jgi:pimeloyl-ACP methyl ester carboxylesterase
MSIFVVAITSVLAAAVVLASAFVGLNWAPDRPVAELKARWAQAPSVFLDIAGMDVHLRDEGPREDAMPIILLHGTSASLHTWEGRSRILTTSRRIIRFDMPGFGLTGPAPDNNYTIEAYVRFVLAVLDRLGVQHCVLGGNSFGGYVAWMTALAAPHRAQRLILVDAGGYPQKSTSVPIGFRIARLPVLNSLAALTLPRSVIESSVRNVYGDPSKVTPELIDLYYAMTVREGNRRALSQRFAQAPPDAHPERISELRLPTLILWGGRDRLIAPESGDRFNRDIAGSQLIVFGHLGHVLHEEDPTLTVAAVKQFLEKEQ